jgi:hypothetical protein
MLGPCKGVIRKTDRATQLVESQPVKRRLGGWCEMAASPGVSQLTENLVESSESAVGSCRLRVEFCTGGCEDTT